MNADSPLLASLSADLRLLEQVVRHDLAQPLLGDRLYRLCQRVSAADETVPSEEPTPGALAIAASVARHVVQMAWRLPQDYLDKAGVATLQEAEQALGAALRQPLVERLHGLYVIVDPQAARGRSLVQMAEAALKGGARVLQLRDKVTDKGDLLPTALRLRDLCHQYDALLIINDHADLAHACGAHGYHGGQHDLPVGAARAVLEPHQLVGRSNALLEEALEAQGVDYVAVGDIFGSPTKQNTRPAGLETLHWVRAQVSAPLAAIGGITEANVHQVVNAGADMVCVISAVVGADDPETAARRLVECMERARQMM